MINVSILILLLQGQLSVGGWNCISMVCIGISSIKLDVAMSFFLKEEERGKLFVNNLQMCTYKCICIAKEKCEILALVKRIPVTTCQCKTL